MEQAKALVLDGYHIVWVGYHSPMRIWVHMKKNKLKQKLVLTLQPDYSQDHFLELKSCSATTPRSNVGTIWSSESRLELLRLASILGINVGGVCIPGCGQEPVLKFGCIMAYDIESDRSRIPLSSFGSLSESITSMATYCSCGDKRVFSFIPNVKFDYILCKNSKDTVTRFFDYVSLHSPQWLIGYNNFGYDNTRIAYHSEASLDSSLIPMRIGSGSSLTYAFYIDIEGTYNVDLLAYFEKTRRSKYQNMRLATLVQAHGIESKMDFDTANVTDFKTLFEYNLHDCKITLELAQKTNVIEELVSLCTVACVPVIDSVRFVTGTFAACSIASYCLTSGIQMDWSPCMSIQEYEGAKVLKPVLGMHENVVCCDFSSMYPTIILGANISIENYSTKQCNATNGSVWQSSEGSNFVIGETLVTFYDKQEAVVPRVVKLFVARRKHVRAYNPTAGNNMKVTGNSIYGSLGDRNSKIYSPLCSAAVTCAGRWCLALAVTIFEKYGFEVVYGDTDSCYVKPNHKCKCSIQEVVAIISCIFLYTPFPGMSMDIEDNFTKIAFLGKKTYFGKNTDSRIVSKGMSKSRKDRIGISRSLASHVVDIVLSQSTAQNMRVTIANMLSLVIDTATSKGLCLSEVSKQVKKGGSNYFEYKTRSGLREALECETYTGAETVDYSAEEVCILVARELRVLLAVSSLGSLKSVMQCSSVL